MQYTALLAREGNRTTIEFPDCPGCATFAEADEDPVAMAREALEGWLEAQLAEGEPPPRPTRVRSEGTAVPLAIAVSPALAARLQIRWARDDLGISQGELAKRMGVPRQQVSRLESTASNITMETLDRVANALDTEWIVTLGTTPHQCVFCATNARRQKVDGMSRYLVDCPTCGAYQISLMRDRTMRSLPERAWLASTPKAIRAANARGMRLYVDDGSQSPLDDE